VNLRPARAVSLAVRALAAALLLLPACGGKGEGPAGPAGPSAPGRPAAPAARQGEGGGLFADVTAASGIDFVHHLGDAKLDNIVEAVGSGACVLDYDGDGRMDVYLVDQGWSAGVSGGPRPATPSSGRLYRNRGDGTFEDVTAKAGVGDDGFGFGAIAGDVDGDGWTDLYLLRKGPNRLLRNRGDGTFEDVTARAGVGDPGCSVAGTFLDADHDGDLDLYVGNYLDYDPDYHLHYSPDHFPGPLAFTAQPDSFYRNRGDGTFEDVSEASGVRSVPPGRAMGVVSFDADGDGNPDVYVANDASAKFLWLGDGKGGFHEGGVAAGVAFGFYGEATASMAGSVGDADLDGLPDLLVTDNSFGSFYRNLGHGRFQDRVRAAGYAQHASSWAHWGGGFLDVDDDGDLDFYAAAADLHYAGRPDLLLENQGDGTFKDLADRGGPYFRTERVSRGGYVLDFDDDGRLDLLVTNIGDRPALLHNVGVNGNHWLKVALRGAPPARPAAGAVVVVEAGGRRWVRRNDLPGAYLGQHDPRLHFGLGKATKVDRLEITWPNGSRETREGVAADQVLVVEQKAAAR
jgi:hypothetical protein